jgi:hypothetical protein
VAAVPVLLYGLLDARCPAKAQGCGGAGFRPPTLSEPSKESTNEEYQASCRDRGVVPRFRRGCNRVRRPTASPSASTPAGGSRTAASPSPGEGEEGRSPSQKVAQSCAQEAATREGPPVSAGTLLATSRTVAESWALEGVARFGDDRRPGGSDPLGLRRGFIAEGPGWPTSPQRPAMPAFRLRSQLFRKAGWRPHRSVVVDFHVIGCRLPLAFLQEVLEAQQKDRPFG